MPHTRQPIEDIPDTDGLLFACLLDGEGGAALLTWDELGQWTPEQGGLWLHLDRSSSTVQTWLETTSGLTAPTVSALLAEETRPRVFRGQRGMVAILRGINFNSDSAEKNLVAIRMWSDGQRLITIRQEKLLTPRDLLAELVENQSGPRTASQLFERLIARLVERMAETVDTFDDALDDIETSLDIRNASVARRELSDVRQNTIELRRYLTPQRDALNNLHMDPPSWLEERSRMQLRETVDRVSRYVDSLDSARERSLVIKDDITNQLSESTNKTLYVLSIISAIFLPLGFLTGLMGINVGGMPGVNNSYAFWITTGLMTIIVLAELIIFRKLKWLA